MKFTLKFDIQEDQTNGQVDVVMQVMHGATIAESYNMIDTTSNMVSNQARRSIETLFEEMANARRDNVANPGEAHAASSGQEDEG
jgi:hypothetical protein